jgi:hypothetical protein
MKLTIETAVKSERQACIDRLAAWFDSVKLFRSETMSRKMAEEILTGNTEARADE